MILGPAGPGQPDATLLAPATGPAFGWRNRHQHGGQDEQDDPAARIDFIRPARRSKSAFILQATAPRARASDAETP